MLNRTKTYIRDYLIKQLPSATAFINTDFVVVHASDRWIESFDFSEVEAFGSSLLDLLNSSVHCWRPMLEHCFSGQPGNTGPFSNSDFSGNEIFTQWQTLPWYDENENVIGAIIEINDMPPELTDRKKLDRWNDYQKSSNEVAFDIDSAENGKLLKTLVDNLPLNVFIKDLDSRKVLVNQSECDFLGVANHEELIGKNDFELYDKEVAQVFRDEDLFVINSLKPILGKDVAVKKPDGTVTNFLTSKIPLIGEDGAIKGLIGISLDITDLKQKEEELRDLINVTSLQNKKLINFAHIISHNLRSHAANFSMLLDFFVYERDPDEKLRLTKMLIDASDNLLETLDNLNEVVAINTNTNLINKPTSLNETVLKVEQSLSAFLKINNAKIVNTISDEIQVNVIPAYLESILMNFITNGVKYKDPSRDPILKLSAKIENGQIIISIKDNGLGIDLKRYGDKLFGMYKTFHNNKDARGIGLYITKNQIEAMHGKVVVQSEVGQGTTFKIYFNEKN